MQIEKLYVYPVKSLRGVSINGATLTKFGFPYDRQFCILQVIDENGDKTFKNMSIAHYNEMCRFFPDINYSKNTMTITHHPIDNGEQKSIDIPLEPDTSDLEEMDVLMHKSPTKAFRMDAKYNDWLSSCFGYETVLAYIGDNRREVRMSAMGYKSLNPEGADTNSGASSWLSSITSIASTATGMIMGNGSEKPSEIKFSDVAPYLFVSSKSMDDVHTRLPAGEDFDITKFRPNVIVSGAEEPWAEDYWGELTIAGKSKVECEHNCGRCRSINIDYETGAQGTGEAGKMLKLLSRDRRVDKGTKWNPIFGRYAFLHPEFEGDEIRVGDEVVVSRTNKEHTAFGTFVSRSVYLIGVRYVLTLRLDWKGLSTLPGGGRD